MNESNFKIGGIYDKRTFLALKEIGINHFEFDFRPRSFNFIQKYVLEEILKSSTLGHEKIFLHFSNEADFVVKDIISLFDSFAITPHLVFSDDQEPSYYSQFDLPFFWHYRAEKKIKDIMKDELNKGIIFDLEFLDELYQKQTITSFTSNFLSIPGAFEKEIAIKMDWGKVLPKLIDELFSPSIIEMGINTNVEICYRNVDARKVINSINFIKNQSC